MKEFVNTKEICLPVLGMFTHQEFHENYRIKHVTSNAAKGNKLHSHNFYELLLCWNDNCYCVVDDQVYHMNRRDLMLVNNSQIHGVIFLEPARFERCVIEFDPEYARDLCEYFNVLSCFEGENRSSVLSLSIQQAEQFMTQFQKLLLLEKNEKEYGRSLQQKLTFGELLLLVSAFAESQGKDRLRLKDANMVRIQKVLTYIQEHLAESITLEDLAEQIYLSKSRFCTVFKQYVGFSPNQYIIIQRVRQAAELLKSGKTIQEAADESGFRDYAHFLRTFKQYMGVTPGQYRQEE